MYLEMMREFGEEKFLEKRRRGRNAK